MDNDRHQQECKTTRQDLVWTVLLGSWAEVSGIRQECFKGSWQVQGGCRAFSERLEVLPALVTVLVLQGALSEPGTRTQFHSVRAPECYHLHAQVCMCCSYIHTVSSHSYGHIELLLNTCIFHIIISDPLFSK